MPILNDNVIPAAGVAGYEIANSLRVNDNDSAYFVRTPASAGNQKTWTLSFWMKKGSKFSAYQNLFDVNNGRAGIPRGGVQLNNTDQISVWMNSSGSGSETVVKPNRKIRDPNAWYHILVVADSTDATASERMRLYINGERQTDLQTGNYASQNTNYPINRVDPHYFCRDYTGSYYYDGYMAEIHFVDGQALTTADFGEAGDYGEWKAVEYTGTYGTNGWYLDFENSGSLGSDVSGNGNNFTLGNLVATDQMLDSPTNNFCTGNPLASAGVSGDFLEGNLKIGHLDKGTAGTMGMSSGKWYFEGLARNYLNTFGIVYEDALNDLTDATTTDGFAQYGGTNKARSYWNGYKLDASTRTAYGDAYVADDIIGVAFDADAGSLTFYRNGVSQGVAFTGLPSGTWLPLFHSYTSTSGVLNFGQDSSFAGYKTAQGNTDDNGYGDFYYAPPTGYLALCTQNLPDATVIPSEHFNTVLWTGDGTASRNITGIGFQPSLTWIKARSVANWHLLQDAVRGAQKQLFSNATNAEEARTDRVKQFLSDGFEIGNWGDVNTNGTTYASWNWKANGSGVSNTDGTITSTVSANTSAGFSIVTYTGNATSGATVGHGLSKAPEVIIPKNRDSGTQYWKTYWEPLGATKNLSLSETAAAFTDSSIWNDTEPTASVFTIGNAGATNQNGANQLAYCFHSVDGYSKVGSYTGNGSADGTFVYCGFKPKFVLCKATTDSTRYWAMHDSERLSSSYNQLPVYGLFANSSGAESDVIATVDMLSNGFKWRTHAGDMNDSGDTFIFLAIAENPFKHANAA